MLNLISGQKVKVSDISSLSKPLVVTLEIAASFEIDFSCFGLDDSGKLSDDRYMTFFNQPQTPCGAVKIVNQQSNNTLSFEINLNLLPSTISKLVLTAAIDGAQTMSQIQHGVVQIKDQQINTAEFSFQAKNFKDEKALMLAEFYLKDGVWRFAAVGQGFNGGLAALVSFFGGAVAEEVPVVPQVPAGTGSGTISLEKKIEKAAPQLVNLAKKATISLEKKQLSQVKAQVGLVLDASGSMNGQYTKGRVQEVIDRLLPLAVHFDDDGSLECWAFGEKTTQLESVTLHNVKDYVQTTNGGWKKWPVGARYNEEPKAIKQVVDFFKKNSIKGVPVYILFISDGGVDSSNSRLIKTLITDAAKLPIFWQFVGIGGSNYGILEKLDDLSGRVVDNCNFFALDDLHDIDEQKLYDLMLEEFPLWLKEVKQKGIL